MTRPVGRGLFESREQVRVPALRTAKAVVVSVGLIVSRWPSTLDWPLWSNGNVAVGLFLAYVHFKTFIDRMFLIRLVFKSLGIPYSLVSYLVSVACLYYNCLSCSLCFWMYSCHDCVSSVGLSWTFKTWNASAVVVYMRADVVSVFQWFSMFTTGFIYMFHKLYAVLLMRMNARSLECVEIWLPPPRFCL